jgi:hypothetical protein
MKRSSSPRSTEKRRKVFDLKALHLESVQRRKEPPVPMIPPAKLQK